MFMTPDHALLTRRYLDDLWSRGALATADAILTPDCTLHDPVCGTCTGPAAIKAAVTGLRRPFSYLVFSLDAIVVEAGAQTALRWFARGRHRATRRTFLLSGLLLLRFAAGRIGVITASWEPLRLLEQLGSPCQPFPVPGESELDAGWA